MLEQCLRCRECEHRGDLDAYARDVSRSGGNVIGRELDAIAEIGHLMVTFDSMADQEAFWEKFKKTESASFCS